MIHILILKIKKVVVVNYFYFYFIHKIERCNYFYEYCKLKNEQRYNDAVLQCCL